MYAGFWKRFVALIIDNILLMIILIPAGIFVGLKSGPTSDYAGLTLTAIWVCYFALLESSPWQATLGKKALGIKVVDKNGNKITFLRALGRNAGKIVSSAILEIGFIMAAFTQQKQALHDIMADCLVVDNNFSLDGAAAQPPQKTSAGVIIIIIAVVGLFFVLLMGGCIAAIALPQYFKAVERGRAAEAVIELKTAQAARERAKLAGKDLANWNDADIVIAGIDAADPRTAEDKNFKYVLRPGNIFVIRKSESPNRYAFTTDQKGVVCIIESDSMTDICGDYTVSMSPNFFK